MEELVARTTAIGGTAAKLAADWATILPNLRVQHLHELFSTLEANDVGALIAVDVLAPDVTTAVAAVAVQNVQARDHDGDPSEQPLRPPECLARGLVL